MPPLRRGRQALGGVEVQLQKRPLPLSKRKARNRDATQLDGIYWRASVSGRKLRRVTQLRDR